MTVRPVLLTAATLAIALFMGAFAATDAQARVYTTRMNIDTLPTGAEALLVDTAGIETPLGLTPLKRTRIPRGMQTLKFRKVGYEELVVQREIGRRTESLVFNLARVIKPGTILVGGQGDAIGAIVKLDGVDAGVIPLNKQVPPGKYQVEVTKAGFLPWTQWVKIDEGATFATTVSLEKAAPDVGTMVVQTTPVGVKIVIQGQEMGMSPVVLNSLKPGSYVVSLSKDGFEATQVVATVVKGETARVDVSLTALAPTTGTLKVLADIPGSIVLIDGKSEGEAPVFATLNPGIYQVEVRAAGHPPVIEMVTIEAGTLQRVEASLVQAKAKNTGSVRIIANVANATVTVDGGAPQAVPTVIDGLSPGVHFFTISAPGSVSVKEQVDVAAEQLQEVVVKLVSAGVLKVATEDGLPANVIVDGKPMGETPWEGPIATGLHKVELERDGEARGEKEVNIGHGKTVSVTLDASKAAVPMEHGRAMTHSAETVGANQGAVELSIGYPHLVNARFMGGVTDWLDLGIAFRSMLDVTNEFEAQAKAYFYAQGLFRLGAKAGLGFGIGAEGRNSVFGDVHAIASLRIRDVASVNLSVGFRFYSDEFSPASSAGRDTYIQVPIGLSVDINATEFINVYIGFQGDPIPGKRRLYDLDIFRSGSKADGPFFFNAEVQGELGLAFIF